MNNYLKLHFLIRWVIVFSMVQFCISDSHGQNDYDFLFDDAENYNEKRFGYAIGSPLLFDPWVIGMVYSNTGQIYYPLLLNYNVQEQKWEARKDDKIITLDPTYFWCVVLRERDNLFSEVSSGDSMLFIRGLLPHDENEFVQVLYNGRNFKLLKIFDVISTKQTSNDNNGFTLNRYLHKNYYYMVSESKHKRIKLAVNDIADAIDKKGKEFKKFLKDQNLHPKGELEWIEVLGRIETELYLEY